MTDTTLAQRLLVRWEATDEPTAKKINRMILERKEAADRIEELENDLRIGMANFEATEAELALANKSDMSARDMLNDLEADMLAAEAELSLVRKDRDRLTADNKALTAEKARLQRVNDIQSGDRERIRRERDAAEAKLAKVEAERVEEHLDALAVGDQMRSEKFRADCLSAELAEAHTKEQEITLTIKRVWAALGNPAYETLNGLTISELVSEAVQNYVDANEARMDAFRVLEKVADARMPGEARKLAVEHLRDALVRSLLPAPQPEAKEARDGR